MITYTLRADNIVRCWAAGNVIYVIDGLKIQTPRRRKYALELCQLINPLLTDWRRRRPINGGVSLEWHSWIVIYRNHKLYSSTPMAVLVAKWGNRLRFIHSSISMILELLADWLAWLLPSSNHTLFIKITIAWADDQNLRHYSFEHGPRSWSYLDECLFDRR